MQAYNVAVLYAGEECDEQATDIDAVSVDHAVHLRELPCLWIAVDNAHAGWYWH